MSTFKLSPSSLSLMKDCPRCFWLNKHGFWKRPSAGFPTLPSGMDRVLKEHFDNFMEKGLMPPEICDNGLCEGMKLFDNKELLEEWRNPFRGVRWTDENGNVLFGGVDNILIKDGKLIVLDYKTRGYPLKEDTTSYYIDQMNLYTLLLNKNGYPVEDYAFLLFYIPKNVLSGGEVVFYTELVKMEVNLKKGEELFNKALKVLNGERPKESCQWCVNFLEKKV